MNLDAYAFDSESDDDDDNERSPIATAKGSHPHIQDINKLKEQTTELLDPAWKETRNKTLLLKMLELEEPSITAKMVDFLLQDGVCEVLLGFVSQIGSGLSRPSPDDNKAPALKLAYKAVVLLSADEPSEPLLALLSKRASAITRACFEMFRDDSAASFYHAYRILECLLRCFPGDVYEGLCGDGNGADRMSLMLRYVGFAPVGELIVMLICLTPVPRMSQLYILSAKTRWQFFEQISQWILMLKITEVVVDPEAFCFCNHLVDAEQHSGAAAQVLQELIEKLSLEDTGELLLQPLGYTTELLDHLVDTTLSMTGSESRRRSTGKLLCFLLRRAAEAEIMCMMASQPGAPPQPTVVPNRLFPLRERIIVHMESRMSELFESILAYNTAERLVVQSQHSPIGPGPINFSGYSVDQPFGSLRALLVELMTLMVESDENVGNMMPVDLWKLLMNWALRYAHNNIYHSFFYRLVFAILRQGQEQAQRMLFQKAKFVNFLVDNFIPLPSTREELPPKHSSGDHAHRAAIRGVLMNCANAVRLQAACQSPSTFLRFFLSSHQRWNETLPKLMLTTEFQHRFGMGVKISEVKAANNFSVLTLTNEIKLPEEENGIELGSRFAKNLGFYEDLPWSEDETTRGATSQINPIFERQNMSFDDDDDEDNSSSEDDDSDGEIEVEDGDGVGAQQQQGGSNE